MQGCHQRALRHTYMPEPCKRALKHQLPKSITMACIAIAALACLQGLRWLSKGYSEADDALQAAASEAVYAPSEAQFLGRSYRQRILQAQLRDKDLQVKYLRTQLESAVQASKLKDDSMKAAENLIRWLREREDAAKQGRSKAQLALAEKASALQSCQVQTESLLVQVTECDKALRRMELQRSRDGISYGISVCVYLCACKRVKQVGARAA
ncbi:hypothetical protein VOLCADRAFT_107679 [Volvox carteri f. nagariensis]|uniref:Uncharacterized protein n=1 Tax=Volvox carteri f. nagariensis TaxID=3068 RepID=D8UFL1_VOLCA|nr:uncharacterized protein VOLCADRAFT_107679 [Volvox carteri f. nagariensis]EFJ41476.1 hypothetical protein VOLCADRAFT_107679 [Volvox carteri f. nagariensis]|eukprot:XP_002957421.1 hypothetical protein VOLCADRAFT_107679 [Volvox carteri f. nagariensis]